MLNFLPGAPGDPGGPFGLNTIFIPRHLTQHRHRKTYPGVPGPKDVCWKNFLTTTTTFV